MRRELEGLHLQMNRTADESLQSTQNMLRMCEESKAAGTLTLNMLAEQGEKLDRIQGDLCHINEDLYLAEKNLKTLERRCCCLCFLPWKRTWRLDHVDHGKTSNREHGDDDDNAEDEKMDHDDCHIPVLVKTQAPSAGYIPHITNDSREQEIEENLHEVNGIIAELRTMAIDMGSAISLQNPQIDDMTAAATGLNRRVREANNQAKNILKN